MRALLLVVVVGCGDASSGLASDAPVLADGCSAGALDGGVNHRDALDGLEASILSLRRDWRFQIDPQDAGRAAGWADPAFDDAGWPLVQAGAAWEDQGFAGYDGVAWYRKRIDVPADWSGSPIRLIADGVDDEYDLFVNGELVRHFGGQPDRSVWNSRTEARIDGQLRAGQSNLIALRVVDWGGGGGLVHDVVARRAVALDEALLPEPVLDGNPEWVDLYFAAWRMAWDKVQFGTPENGFVHAYMDDGFNEQIYQWDGCFIALFGRYGARLFPAMETLDNFYAAQRADGYIQRVYSQNDGREVAAPTRDEPMVNPPLFAWAEWEYYVFSGDASRLPRVLPHLVRYYDWLAANVTSAQVPGLYYQTGLGSGMDNTPRGDVGGAGWVDMSLEQALAARALADIAHVVGDAAVEMRFRAEHDALAARINQLAWAGGFYYDVTGNGQPAGVKHAGAFWALLADVADDTRAASLVAHLENPAEFHRPHLFPTLAASEPAYDGSGHYWLGGVWAPTNYMIVKGLDRIGQRALAREAAANYLSHLAEVYAHPPTSEEHIAPEERDGDYQTLWECYSPERDEPGTRWDGTYYCRQDFVGWTGLGPIAMLIEDVLGLEVRGAERRIVWRITRADRHGIRRLPLGDATVDLIATPRGQAIDLDVHADAAFDLDVSVGDGPQQGLHVCAGDSSYSLPR